MLRNAILRTTELIVLAVLIVGALLGAALIAPPCGVSISGRAKISQDEVINFGFQIGKQIIVRRPMDVLRKAQLNTL